MTDPHGATIRIYRERAADWVQVRRADTAPARAFRDWLGPTRPGRVVDLGCGPGWHLDALPEGTVGLDAAPAMLALARSLSPGSPLLAADLRALPLAGGCLDGAWAARSLVHLDRRLVPMALWDLHRAVRVGGGICLHLFEGDADHAQVDDDDLAGRWFHAIPEALLRHLLEGAGFDVGLWDRTPGADVDELRIWARRTRTLADTVGPDMRLLLVGLNPSLVAADAGVGFHRPGNRAWPALRAAGLATVDRDPVDLLERHRIGMTDLAKRATARADDLRPEEYRHGIERLDGLCRWLRPAAVCVLGVTGWRAAVDPGATTGVQGSMLGGRPVYLMPNPSGANARVGLDELVGHLGAAAALADSTAP